MRVCLVKLIIHTRNKRYKATKQKWALGLNGGRPQIKKKKMFMCIYLRTSIAFLRKHKIYFCLTLNQNIFIFFLFSLYLFLLTLNYLNDCIK